MCNTQSSVPDCIIYINLFPHISVTLTLKSTHLPGRYMFCKQCTLLNLSAFITTILSVLSVYQLAEWQQKSIFHAYQITRPPRHPPVRQKIVTCSCCLRAIHLSFYLYFLYFSKDKHNLSSFVLWLQKGIWLLVSLLVKRKVRYSENKLMYRGK